MPVGSPQLLVEFVVAVAAARRRHVARDMDVVIAMVVFRVRVDIRIRMIRIVVVRIVTRVVEVGVVTRVAFVSRVVVVVVVAVVGVTVRIRGVVMT
jgi:hypothetical protein